MPKKLLIILIVLNLGVAFCLIISEDHNFTNPRESDKISLHEGLINEQIRVESEYLKYVEKLKNTVVSVSLSKDVQKLRRANLRKKFFKSRKADAAQSTVRYATYTVKQKNNEITVRPIYETFKSKIFWDKLLQIMAKQALISTNEMKTALHPSGSEKFTEIINIFLKDAGLGNLENPGYFNEFSMLGEDIIFYWNVVLKKCSSSIRKTIGSTQCVRGIFTAEIDRSNSVRDFARNWQQREVQIGGINTEFGHIKGTSNHSFIEAYWPPTQHSNSELGQNVNQFLIDRGSRFFREGNKLALISKSHVLPNAILVSKVDVNVSTNFPYIIISLILLSVSSLLSIFYLIKY